MIARSEISHSGRFSLTKATRSPLSSPRRFSDAASDATCRAAPAQLIERHSPSRLAHKNGASPFSVERARNSATRLSKRSSCRAIPPARALLRNRRALAARIGGTGPAAVDPFDRIRLEARRDRFHVVPKFLELRDHRLQIRSALDV